MKVNIDEYAGFCFGVRRAIDIAEKELTGPGNLFSLGEIVHNPEEIKRLEKTGLVTINHRQLNELSTNKIFIRAHGEPPATFEKAKSLCLKVIDGTCPVVLKLQQRVKKAYAEIVENGGTILIYGKKNHPEVIGLSGQTQNKAVVVESVSDLENIDFTRPIYLFVQTTASEDSYQKICNEIQNKITHAGSSPAIFKPHKSLCGEVTSRVPKLLEFCKQNDVIVFVSGANSSNGKYLFSICMEANPESHHISSASEVSASWFNNHESVGISGATSTPGWLMKEVANKISAI